MTPPEKHSPCPAPARTGFGPASAHDAWRASTRVKSASDRRSNTPWGPDRTTSGPLWSRHDAPSADRLPTVIVAAPVRPSIVAVTVAVPTATAVTSPASVTVATAGRSDTH